VSTNKIIVGYDGSRRAHDALAFAAVLARATRATLILTNVYRGERAVALDLLEEAERSLPYGVRADVRALPGPSVTHALRDLARAEEAELIVLGSHRGSHWDGALAVAPAGFSDDRDPGLRVIGVAFDGSPEARDALAFAVDLAMTVGATLRLIGVAEPVPPPTAGMSALYLPDSELDHRTALMRELESAAEELPASLRTQVVLVDGNAAPKLKEAAGALSLLVMGSHGRGPVLRVLLGSVSRPLLRAAPCPVLVVPHARRAQRVAA
jgi:nucleotide-binding universal stress UspA family protein